MKQAMEMVREFHDRFDVPVQALPGLPDDAEERRLRMNLVAEEFFEYLKAEVTDDLIEIADGLADLIYVACGTALAYGIPLTEIFEEVHRTNMLKEGGGTRADGKILKPEGWEPPQIEEILQVRRNLVNEVCQVESERRPPWRALDFGTAIRDRSGSPSHE